MRSFDRRLARLEVAQPRQYADVLALIARHAYYDEITPQEQARYCGFIGIEKKAFEDCNTMVLGNCHIMLEKVDKPTPEEFEQLIIDIEHYVKYGGSL